MLSYKNGYKNNIRYIGMNIYRISRVFTISYIALGITPLIKHINKLLLPMVIFPTDKAIPLLY